MMTKSKAESRIIMTTRIRTSTFLLMVVAELLVLLSTTSLASSPNFPLGQSTRRKQRIPRTLQSWAIRRQAKPKPTVVIQSNNNSKDPPGSIFTFSKPTKQNIAKWFGVDEDMNQMIRCMLREEFNHDSVGMTNPFLHIDTHDDTNNLLLQVQTTNNENGDTNNIVLPVLQSNTDDSSTGWWPSLLFPPFGKKKWRILTYRVKVGTGRECYERVRDAALDWQFQTNDLGLLSVPSSSEVEMWNLKEKNMPKPPSPYVSGFYRVTPIETTQEESQGESIAFHRSIGSARRLVSFSASRLVPLLPKIYAVNPVMVVYDLVDQRGPGTTFSSTAYATMKGHLLRGEERVTVALRDGTQAVDVEILSISKSGASLKAKVIWPFIGKMQATFFEQQMNFLERLGSNVYLNN